MLKRSFLLLLLSILLMPVTKVAGQDMSTRKGEITSLNDGQAIRGIVPVEGSTMVDGFLSWEMSYGYANDTTGTWFFIAESMDPIVNGFIANWDTTQITDGNYKLRLTLFLEKARRSHTIVQNLRVRNYTPIETDTPEPTLTSTPFTESQQPSQSLRSSQIPSDNAAPPSPTVLPANDLELSSSTIANRFLRGAAGVLVAFMILGIYSTVKKSLGK